MHLNTKSFRLDPLPKIPLNALRFEWCFIVSHPSEQRKGPCQCGLKKSVWLNPGWLHAPNSTVTDAVLAFICSWLWRGACSVWNPFRIFHWSFQDLPRPSKESQPYWVLPPVLPWQEVCIAATKHQVVDLTADHPKPFVHANGSHPCQVRWPVFSNNLTPFGGKWWKKSLQLRQAAVQSRSQVLCFEQISLSLLSLLYYIINII